PTGRSCSLLFNYPFPPGFWTLVTEVTGTLDTARKVRSSPLPRAPGTGHRAPEHPSDSTSEEAFHRRAQRAAAAAAVPLSPSRDATTRSLAPSAASSSSGTSSCCVPAV